MISIKNENKTVFVSKKEVSRSGLLFQRLGRASEYLIRVPVHAEKVNVSMAPVLI